MSRAEIPNINVERSVRLWKEFTENAGREVSKEKEQALRLALERYFNAPDCPAICMREQ